MIKIRINKKFKIIFLFFLLVSNRALVSYDTLFQNKTLYKCFGV